MNQPQDGILPANAPPAGDPTARQWLHYGDAIRIVAPIAVIIGHVADMYLFDWWFKADAGVWRKPPDADWRVCNYANALTRWAVPLYIMLSGAVLLRPASKGTVWNFYWRRVSRVGFPLLLWAPLYMWFDAEYARWTTWDGAWMNLLKGMPYAHLHFLFVVLGLYAITPMLRLFIATTSRRMLAGAVVIALVLAAANSWACVKLNTPLNAFNRFMPFIGYFLAGYLLRDVRVGRLGLLACAAAATGMVWLLAAITEHYTLTCGIAPYPSWSMLAYDFVSAPRIVYSLLVWVIFVNLFRGPFATAGPARWWRVELTACTMGVYLLHPLIRDVMFLEADPKRARLPAVLADLRQWAPSLADWLNDRIPVRHFQAAGWENMVVGVAAVSAMVYLPSLLLSMGLRRIPLIGRAIGWS